MSGVRFGAYTLHRRLAVGGMGEVFLASLTADGAPPLRFALKRIRPESAAKPGAKQMFVDEVNVLSRVDHPNLVRLFDFGEVEGQLFLATEYVEGASLLQLIDHLENTGGRPLAWPLVAHVGLLLSEALSYLHGLVANDGTPLGLLHRDLNPSNVLIGRNGSLKVIDFGIAWLQQRAQDKTQVGTVKGKPGYLAPEQIREQAIDARADLYALGLTLYRLLTGRLPFDAANLSELMKQILEDEVHPIRSARRDVPPPLEELIDALVSKQPSLRPASAEACRKLCAQALAAASEPVGTAELAAWVQHTLGPARGADAQLTAPLTLVGLGRLFLGETEAPPPPLEASPLQPTRSWWSRLRGR